MAVVTALLLMPAMFFINILSHESYHALSHSEYAEKIYIDLNSKTLARTIIEFPNQTMNNMTKENIKKEEKIANKVGNAIATLYLIIFVLAMIWVISFLRRYDAK